MAELIEFKTKTKEPVNLVGRLLMLNLAMADPKTQRFQCGGFLVNNRRLIEVVTDEAFQPSIRIALDSGLLIDVTENDIARKGFEFKSSSASRINSEDTGKKAYMTRDAQGRMIVAIPKDEEEQIKFEADIEKQGYINIQPEESENFTGFTGGVIEEEV